MIAVQSKTRRQPGRADILPLDEYTARIRSQSRREITELKRRRRIEVGPFATFYFENFATMWSQVHEMLYIEKGGDPQIADEFGGLQPADPGGSEPVATVMFEIDDPKRRARTLMQLGGIENSALIEPGGIDLGGSGLARIRGELDSTRENTNPEGKVSSVQFICFRFTPDEIAAFKAPDSRILVGFDHPRYAHMARLPEPVRAALAEDFD
jgi:hypothetical protein